MIIIKYRLLQSIGLYKNKAQKGSAICYILYEYYRLWMQIMKTEVFESHRCATIIE